MPLNGWLTAKFGRKRFYAGCVAIFTIASFLCGTATNVWQLTFYRILQGFGGGALQPTAQAIIFETFPPEKRGMADGDLRPRRDGRTGARDRCSAATSSTTPRWPLIFFVNLPIGIAAFFMTIAFIPDPHYLAETQGRHRLARARTAFVRRRRDAVRARTRPARRLVRFLDDRHSHFVSVVATGVVSHQVAARRASAGRFALVPFSDVRLRESAHDRRRLRAVRHLAHHAALLPDVDGHDGVRHRRGALAGRARYRRCRWSSSAG